MSEGAPPRLGVEQLATVLEALPDGVGVIDAAATIVWVNARFRALTGWSDDELLGRNGLDLLDPDQLRDAIDALTITRDTPFVLPPGVYRLAHRDGRYVTLELHAAPLDPTDPDSMIAMLFRPIEYQVVMTEGIEVLNAGGPIEDMARYITEGIGWTSGAISVVYDEETTGRRRAVSSGLPPELDGSIGAPDGISPWEEVEASGQPVERPLDELPPSIRDAAKQLGYVSCSADPVPDAGGRDAVIILWFEVDAPANYRFLFREEPRYLLLRLALERRHLQSALHAAASTDPLTGLANRASFFDELERDAGPGGLALLYIDLDDFKPINDTHGHLAGDAVLVEIGRRLREVVGSDDVVARLGGDEFAVLCRGVTVDATAELLAERIHAALTVPVHLAPGPVKVRASIGVAIALDAGPADPEHLLELADRLQYAVKHAGKDGWRAATLPVPGA